MRLLRTKSNDSELNKGFTLVELIVSIAIFAIVAAAIIAFFRVAMTQYRTNTNEVNIQTESQMAWKRLESNVLIATNGVWTPSSSRIDLYSYNSDAEHKKTVTSIYYSDDPSNHTVYYQEYYIDENNNMVAIDDEQHEQQQQKFASLVTAFEIKIYDKDGNVIDGSGNLIDKDGNVVGVLTSGTRPYKVSAHIEYDANGRTYTSDNTVAIRNTIVASNNPSEIYANIE
jgi:prepilin-type N-terminal cleavage/methylation domain-containing protein